MKRTFAFFLFALCLISFSVSSFANTADKSELSALLSEIHDPSKYTAQSYQSYQRAVNGALSVYESDTASQENVNTVTAELKEAKKGLVLILNREPLLDYVDGIDEFLSGTNYDLTAETIQILTSLKNEFLKLYESETLTQEQLDAANTEYKNVIETAETNSKEVKKFSGEDADENVIVPSKVISSTQGLGRVTTIRLTLLLLGFGLILLGGTASILYLKPPKFLK